MRLLARAPALHAFALGTALLRATCVILGSAMGLLGLFSAMGMLPTLSTGFARSFAIVGEILRSAALR